MAKKSATLKTAQPPPKRAALFQAHRPQLSRPHFEARSSSLAPKLEVGQTNLNSFPIIPAKPGQNTRPRPTRPPERAISALRTPLISQISLGPWPRGSAPPLGPGTHPNALCRAAVVGPLQRCAPALAQHGSNQQQTSPHTHPHSTSTNPHHRSTLHTPCHPAHSSLANTQTKAATGSRNNRRSDNRE